MALGSCFVESDIADWLTFAYIFKTQQYVETNYLVTTSKQGELLLVDYGDLWKQDHMRGIDYAVVFLAVPREQLSGWTLEVDIWSGNSKRDLLEIPID